jgi:hypothetical protein
MLSIYSQKDTEDKTKTIIVWRTDPLLNTDLETNNETTAVAMQQRDNYASTTI